MKFIDITPGSENWRAWRKTKIGASDAPIIMGSCPFGNTPYTLWQEKMGLSKDKNLTKAMRQGIELEDYVRHLLEERFETKLEPKVVQSSDKEWMIASLDAYNDDLLVEIKVSAHTAQAIREENIPPNYLWQCQHQLAISKNLSMVLAVYDPEQDKLELEPIDRDEKMIDTLLAEEEKFYEFMNSGEPPPLTPKDYVYLGDDVEFTTYETLLSLAMERKEAAEEEIKEYREKILSRCSSPSKGNIFKIMSYAKKGLIDYSKIPALKGVDLEIYRKPSSTIWQIRKLSE